jgi:type II secretory pathway component PulF
MLMLNSLTACLILVGVGVSLRMSLKLLYGARGPRNDDPIFQILNVLGWGFILFPAAMITVMSTSFIGILLGLIIISTLVEVMLARREIQRHAIWTLLAADSGQSVDSLRRHQNRFTGIVGRAFRRLLNSLESGISLPAAIASNPRALPREAQAVAAVSAFNSGSVFPAHDPQSHSHGSAIGLETLPNWQDLTKGLSYLVTIVIAMSLIMTFVMIKIVPSFQAIFDDFEIDLPKLTQLLIASAQIFVDSHAAALLVMLIILLFLAVIVIAIAYLCDVPVLRPLTDRVFMGFHRGLVLRLLAIAAQRGEPFTRVLHQLTHEQPFYPSRPVRKRLDRAKMLMFSGADWKESLAAASLIKRADIPLLATAERAGNLAWVLQFLADQKARLLVFRWKAFEQITFPMVIVAIGLAVGIFCVAIFVPLVSLIESLC